MERMATLKGEDTEGADCAEKEPVSDSKEAEQLRAQIAEKENRIEALEAQNEALDERLAALEDRIGDDTSTDGPTPEEPVTGPSPQYGGISRRGTLAALAGLGVLGLSSQPAAAATDGDNLTFGGAFVGSPGGNTGLEVDNQNEDGFEFGLVGRTKADQGRALAGFSDNESGSSIALLGRNQSSDGTGIRALCDSETGGTNGIFGQVRSPSGRGIYATNTADTGGPALGCVAQSNSTDGTGLRGIAIADSGETTGIEGISESSDSDAVAVRADAPNGALGVEANANENHAIEATSVDYTAIRADTNGPHYNAIYGRNTATSGFSWGVRGDTHSESQNAYGVRGVAEALSGAATGVSGEASGSGDGAAGVKGHASASDVEVATKGVEGISDADANNSVSPEIIPAGVHGITTGEDSTHGVRGETESLNGRGVAGFATTEAYDHDTFTGSAIGVMGITDRSGDTSGLSDSGGVFGWTTATSGSTYGVLGRNASSDGWGVLAMDTSGEALALRASGDTELSGDTLVDGDHETTGDTELGGELEFADATPQRTAGPIAKGYINADGTIENAVNVDSAEWHSGEERYRINLTNEYYFFNEYATTVTPVQDCTFRITSNGGDMAIEFRDDEGDLIQTMFQFVTHKLPNGVVTNDTDVEALETTTDDGASGNGAASEET